MRFTKIPLIATLLAGALSLLFLLPAFGQTSGEIERTEGRVTSGDLQVGVYENLADAKVAKLVEDTYPPSANKGDAGSRTFYRPPTTATEATGGLAGVNVGSEIVSGLVTGAMRTADPAYGISPYTATRNTFFDSSLYIGGGKTGSYNTALITLRTDLVADACDAGTDDPDTAVDESTMPDAAADYPVAKVTNPSRGYDIDVPLAPAAFPEDSTPFISGQVGYGTSPTETYVQAFFNVVDDTDDSLSRADKMVDGPNCYYYARANGSMDFGQIGARHGDRLTVRITGQASNISLIVDAEGPEINLISPVDTSVVKSSNLSFRFDVRDPDSGLRHDGEYTLSNDGDPTSVNPDRDANRGSEPRSESAPSLFGVGNGKAADIQAVYWNIENSATSDVGDRLTDSVRDTQAGGIDITDQGRWAIIGGRAGVGYSFSATGNNFDSAKNALQFTATDRVGNMTTSDADLERTGDQPYIFEVDDNKPTIENIDVRTGISYDNSDSEEEVNRSAIALKFSEPIKSGDIAVSRITVAGNSVTGVIQPNGAPIVYRAQSGDADPADCTLDERVSQDHDDNPDTPNVMVANPNKCPGTDIQDEKIADTRSLVFLQLEDALEADEDPAVTLLSGAVQDLAGNSVNTTSLESEDWIAPTLTVSVTGTKGDRPVANDDGAFVIAVTSDEDLSGRPRVVFAEIRATANAADADNPYSYSVGPDISNERDCNLTPDETDRSWSRSCGVGEQIVDGITGMVGVFVLAKDEDDNLAVVPTRWTPQGDPPPNTPGHRAAGSPPKPIDGNAVDVQELQDAGLLIEIDNIFNSDGEDAPAQQDPTESVTPQSGDDAKKTESPNPFIHIDFEGEASEYDRGDFKDSHGTVTITEIKLGDDDATDRLSRVDRDEFSIVLRDLAVGKYTLTYKAEDDAGNEYNNGEFKFEVLARKPYKVNVKPGWNLISLPGAPENSGIADVLSSTEFLTPVLAYQNGDWLTARRTDDGWDGSLTDIEAGYGYWVHAQTFETISTLLTEIDPASVPPTVPVTRGWNLLGVIDVDQSSAGSAPGTGDNADEADNYFGSIPWKVAYSYDTQDSRWQRYTPKTEVNCRPGADADAPEVCDLEIKNGQGYWVWSERPSTLVP